MSHTPAFMETTSAPSRADGKPPLLSVVMPCYNERYTIREVLRRVDAVAIDKEIIVVDDGSTDGTRELLAGLGHRYPNMRVLLHARNQGKGAAIRTGFRESQGEFVLVQDADLEYSPSDYPALLAPLLSGQADVVFGSRFMAGPRRVHLFWHMIANRVLTLLSSLATNFNLTDMETGYKVFRGDIIRDIPLRSNRFGFEPEVTAKVARLGCRLYEVPISYSGRDYAEGKKIGLKDGFSAIYTILKYWLVSDVADAGHHTLARMAELGQYNKELYHAIEPALGSRVMDLGSGVGNLAGFVLDRPRVVLADNEAVYLTILNRRFGSFENVQVARLNLDTFTAADVAALDVDSVMCLNVLEHIEDDERVLRELAAGLPPGGRLALVVPSMRALYSKLDSELGHYRRYERDELVDKLTRAGFTVESCRFFNWIGALGWFIFGRILRRSHITRAATRGFRFVSKLRTLEGEKGFSVGLSLIAIATRK
jgi:glycosyltransferase involved in cell wall biosynthesis